VHSTEGVQHNGSLLGLWIVHTTGTSTLLASVQAELYVLAFSSATRATSCLRALGSTGQPFYVCQANVEAVLRDARDSGARGFIVDYDADRAHFAAAHPLPAAAASELR
jgi:hypothetical protein